MPGMVLLKRLGRVLKWLRATLLISVESAPTQCLLMLSFSARFFNIDADACSDTKQEHFLVNILMTSMLLPAIRVKYKAFS